MWSKPNLFPISQSRSWHIIVSLSKAFSSTSMSSFDPLMKFAAWVKGGFGRIQTFVLAFIFSGLVNLMRLLILSIV